VSFTFSSSCIIAYVSLTGVPGIKIAGMHEMTAFKQPPSIWLAVEIRFEWTFHRTAKSPAEPGPFWEGTEVKYSNAFNVQSWL
jgi:hypothetical protein